MSFDLFGGLPQSKSDYNYVLCHIYLSFVSAFIQFEICVGSDSLAFVGMDMINGSSGEFDSLYILFQIMEIVCVFLGSNWKWYFLFMVESSSGIWNYSFVLCVLGYLNIMISLICRTCGDERFRG